MPDSSNALLDAIANPRQVDVLGAYRGANNILQGQWAVREMQARQLAGQAQQGAINPATGEYSPERYRQNLAAAGPDAALATQSGLAANQALSSDQLNQARDKLGWVAKASGAALTAGDFSDAAVMRVLQQGSADKMLTMPEIARQLATLPPDPAGRKAWFEQHQNQAMSTQQQLELRYGAPLTVDDGQQVVGGTRSVQTGAISVPLQPGVQTYPSRATLAGRVQVGVDATGAPIYGPAANVTPPNLAGPAAGGGALGTGRLPPALVNPANPANQPPAVPNNGNVTTGLGPAQSAAQTATGTQSAAAFQTYASEGDKAVQQQSVLSSMLGDTKGFTTGPGAATMANFQRSLQRIGTVLGTSFGVNPDRVAANESFNKLASQLADAQGAGSDARLSVNKAANPHEDMSPAGVDLVIRQLQGNADYKVAKAKLASAFPNKADNIAFENQVRTNLDPRAFQFERMTPPQRKTYYAGLTEHDQKAVKSAYNWAVTNGLIGAGNAGQ